MFAALNSFQAGSKIPVGQEVFTTAGTYSWTCPYGVTAVSVVCVGAGSSANNGGAGGGLGYKNNINVVPGNAYTVVVGAGGTGNAGNGGDSYFINTSTVKGGGGLSNTAPTQNTGGAYTGDGGGNGGSILSGFASGGGAGGYSGNGGNGSNNQPSSNAGSGGAGGAGAYGAVYNNNVTGSGGGGVGLLGEGTSGGQAQGVNFDSAEGGKGGSGGTNGSTMTASTSTGTAGLYGGGGAYTEVGASAGGGGAVRIIWAGTTGITRAFPSTNTGDL